MHSHGPREDPLTDLGYETRDINVKGLQITAGIFFLFTIIPFAIIAAWYYFAEPQMNAELAPNKPMPSILLQSNIAVRADIATFRQAETKRLSTGGQNPDGSYYMPIEQAMGLIAQRGLPHVATETKAVSPGNRIEINAIGPAAPTVQPGGQNAQP